MNDELTSKDLEHLRLLSIGFYIYAGLTALFSCIPFIHLAMGIAIVNGAMNTGGRDAMPVFMGWFFIVFASLFIACGWALAVVSLFAGKYLKNQQKYMFVFVVAIICCAFTPMGTILGVFSLIVLTRPAVKDLFRKPVAADRTTFNPPEWR